MHKSRKVVPKGSDAWKYIGLIACNIVYITKKTKILQCYGLFSTQLPIKHETHQNIVINIGVYHSIAGKDNVHHSDT